MSLSKLRAYRSAGEFHARSMERQNGNAEVGTCMSGDVITYVVVNVEPCSTVWGVRRD